MVTARSLGLLGAVAVLASASTVVFIGAVRAAPAATPTLFVPMTPCRLVDTRPSQHVGDVVGPIGPQQEVVFQVRGANGQCVIPDTALGIVANATIVSPTAASHLTIWPADVARPNASNLNWSAGAGPTPNQVTVGLSDSGAIRAVSHAGTVHLVVDVVGYFVAAPPVAPTTTAPPQSPPGIYHSYHPFDTALSGTGGDAGATPIGFARLPAGMYLVTFTATVVNFTPTTDIFRCVITRSGFPVVAQAAVVGPTVGAVVPMTVQTVILIIGTTTQDIEVLCKHDNNIANPGNLVKLDAGATMTVLPVQGA
jgi:hypothetical protein